MAGISLNTKIEQLYKLLENCKVYLSPSDLQRQSDVIPLLRHIYDLVRLPAVKHHSTFPRLLTTAINHLLTFCGSRDQAVRLAASDVLNKTIKVLQQDHMSRVIGELFQEIRKQGESRVLRAALTRFGVLCGRIRQQKCSQYANQLLPIVTQLLSRQDDSLQDCLQDTLPRLLMVFSSYYSEDELVQLSQCCLEQLASQNAANRRTAAETLSLLCQYCMKPIKCTKWSVAHMMQGLLIDDVKDHVICGLLLCLRQLIPLVTMETDDDFLFPKIYCLLLRCCLHSNHNVVTGALEALSVLLWKPFDSMITWLTTELDHMIPLCPISTNEDSIDKASSSLHSCDVMHTPSDDNTPEPSDRDDIAARFHSNMSLNNMYSPSPSNISLSNSDMHDPPSPTRSDMSDSPLHSGDDESTSSLQSDNDKATSPLHSDVDKSASPILSCDDKSASSLPSGGDKSASPLHGQDDISTADSSILTPCDDRFTISLSTTDASVSMSMASARPTSSTLVLSCDTPNVDLAALQLPGTTSSTLVLSCDTPDVDLAALQLPGKTSFGTPLQTLLQLLGTRLLSDHVRVSVKAVAMQCIVAITTWSPLQLLVTMETVSNPKLIELLLPYMECDDPKLCGNCCQVISHYIKGLLLWDSSDHVISLPSAIDKVVKVMSDKSAMVLHAAIPSLQAFLVPLATSHFSNLLDVVMETLSQLTISQSYWLVKCDLLTILTSLDHTLIRATHRSAIVKYVLDSLRDGDSRVQDHAVQAVARLIKNCCVEGVDHTIQTAQHLIPKYLNANFYSVTKDHVSNKKDHVINRKDHMIQPGLSTSLQFILKCCHDNFYHYACQHEMVGLVKCIRQLCHDYPPTQYMWCGQLSIIEHFIGFMEGFSLAYDLCCHANMLYVTSNLIVAMATKHLVANPEPNKEWAAIGIVPLVAMVKKLFKHCMRCIKICHTVLEEQVSDVVTKATTAPIKASAGQRVTKSSAKKELSKTIKHNHGNFTNIPHYVKLFTTVKNVYTVYQITMETAKTDKFYTFLCSALGALASLLDIALADDVAKHTDEICSYLSVLNVAEPWTGLLCVQQLLNALFGMNTAAHRVNMLSPILLSHVTSSLTVTEPSAMLSDILLVHPMDHMITSLTSHEEVGVVNETTDGHYGNVPLQGIKRIRGLFSKKPNAIAMDKPANSSAIVKEHIRHFEPLVVSAMKQFSSTTSLLLQERTLFLVVQLLHLRVNYQLLDPNKIFLDSVLKLLSVIEDGHVRGSAQLIPYLFQFLVLLSREQPRLMSIPQVMQRCDQVLASGRNVSTYAIPALQPLVVNLFMKMSLPLRGDQLEAEREVVLMMMLRLLGYHQVVSMCALVLECYRDNRSKWEALSDQILPVLLPYIAKYDVTMDTHEKIASLFKLMTTISMKPYSIRALFECLISKAVLDTVEQYVMWVGLQCAVLRLLNRLLHEYQEQCIFTALKDCCLTKWPHLSSYDGYHSDCKIQSSTAAMQLAGYFMGSLHYCISVLEWLHHDSLRSCDQIELLTQLCFDWLLSLQYMNKCPCDLIPAGLKDHVTLGLPPFLDDKWWSPVIAMATCKPIISLHVSQLLAVCGYHDNLYWQWLMTSSPKGPYQGMLRHATLLIMCKHELMEPLREILGHHANPCVSMIVKMWSEEAIQQYRKRSCDPSLIFTALSSLDYDHLTAVEISHCFKLLTSYHDDHPNDVVPLLCKHFTGSHVLAVAIAAQRIVIDKLKTNTYSDIELLRQLLNELPHNKQLRCAKILEAIGKSVQSPLLVPSQSECSNGWLEDHIKRCCHDNKSDSNMCAQLLHYLSLDTMATIIRNQDFSSSHLACCLATGIQYTKSSKLISLEEVGPDVTRKPDKLLVAVKNVTLSRLSSCDPANDDLLLATLWLLLANSLLGSAWDSTDAVTMVKYLEQCIDRTATEELAHAVAMLLQSHDLSSLMTNEMTEKLIAMTCDIVGKATQSAHENIMTLLDVTHTKVFSKQLVYGLARLPLVNSYATAPPTALQFGWKVGEELPKDLLKERNIVEEGMIKRTGQIGWLSRLQFEEVWMQSLSVLNSSVTDGDDQIEDHVMLTCRGLQSITSLLMMTLWRPEPGNPLIGSLLHTCRHRNIPFLDTKPGKHFAHIKQRIENELLVAMSTRNDVCSYHGISSENEAQVHLYSNNVERKIGSCDLSYGQLSMPSIWSIIYHEVTNTAPQGRGDVDTKSCIVLLMDLFTQWLNGDQLSHVIITEIIKSVVFVSDLFFTAEQYDWMLLQFVALDDQLPSEDTIGHSYLIYGMLKCIAVLRMPGGSIMDHVIRTCDVILQSRQSSAILLQEACLRGLLYCMEIIPSGIVSAISNSLCSYCLEHLKDYHQYCEQHLLLVWAVTMVMIECHASEIHQENFIADIVMRSIDLLKSHNPLMSFYQAICHGLEQLLLTFSLSSEHRSLLAATSISRLQSGRSGYCGTLSALGLLLCCVYTGEEGEALIGFTMDTTAVARERITCIVEWLRRAPHPYTLVIAQILPQLIVDLLPTSEAVSMIINEFLSPQQVHMKSAAAMLVEVFQHIHRLGNSHVITKWLLLMIGNVFKRGPVAMAIWYSCCLFVAACTSDVLLKLLPLVTSCDGDQPVVMETFHHAGVDFYINQLTVNEDRVEFIKLLTEVSPLHHCYQQLLAACNSVT